MLVIAAETAEHFIVIWDRSCFGGLEKILVGPAMAILMRPIRSPSGGR